LFLANQNSRSTSHTSFSFPQAKNATKVYCDCCPDEDDDDKKTLALKTCLKCEVSLCGEHLRAHMERSAFSGHPLVSPLADLPERRCPQHGDRLLLYYCETSRRYACNVCALEGKRAALVTDAAGALGRRMTVIAAPDRCGTFFAMIP